MKELVLFISGETNESVKEALDAVSTVVIDCLSDKKAHQFNASLRSCDLFFEVLNPKDQLEFDMAITKRLFKLNPLCHKCNKKIFYTPICPYCGQVQRK